MNADYLIVMCALAIGLLALFAGYGRGFRSNAEYRIRMQAALKQSLGVNHIQAERARAAEKRARLASFAHRQEAHRTLELTNKIDALKGNNRILSQRVSIADAFYHLVVDVIDGSSIDTYRQRYLKAVAERLHDGETLEVAKRNVGKKPKRNSKRGKHTVAELIANDPYGVRSAKKPRKISDKVDDASRWEWHQNTGECPYNRGTLVDVEYKDGSRQYGVKALCLDSPGVRRYAYNWAKPTDTRYGALITFHRPAALPDLPPRYETAEEVRARKAVKSAKEREHALRYSK